MKTILVLFLFTTGFLISCAQQDEGRFKERAELEETAKAKADLDSLNRRAKEMEADLEKRHRFYQSISGEYKGDYTTASGAKFSTKIKLIPSLPPYIPSDRIRTIEEVSSDINNLYFNIQILHWAPNNPSSATGCVFQEVRGDLERGKIDVAKSECANVYSLHIVDAANGAFQKPEELEENSSALAQKILANQIQTVDFLKIIMQPSNFADEYVLELMRIKQ